MSVDIAEYATRLLNISGIETVISIDDDNSSSSSPEELLAVLSVVDQQLLTEVVGPLLSIESGDRDLIRDAVKNDWATFSKEVHDSLVGALTARAERSAESIALAVDMRVTSKLPEIFGERLHNLTLAEWEKQRDRFVNDQMPPTLLLVDLSFTGEERGKEAGLEVIADLLKMNPSGKIYCGLLTSVYQTSSVHADWKRIASDHALDRERFVLIPKDSLNEDKRTFLALIKLVVMNGPANILKRTVGKAFEQCLKESEEELGKLDVFEFERIVCLTSAEEGVWEPDTLLRLVSLFHKKLVRRTLHTDAHVYEVTDHLRKLTNVRVGEWGGSTEMEVALRRLEWFEDGNDINKQRLPIELGDVFKIDSKPDRLYILLAQPCDLMVRKDGKRHHTVENALLVEASPVRDDFGGANANSLRDEGYYFALDFFEPGRDWEVNLRKTHYVNLDVLDLCVFRQDGCASFSLDDTVPSLMPEAWRARFPRLADKVKKACVRYTELMKMAGMKPVDASKMAMNTVMGNLWKVTIDSKKKSVTFDVCRVARIKQPRSGSLLAKYANALARDAFEHDLIRRPDRGTRSIGEVGLQAEAVATSSEAIGASEESS